MNDLFRKRNILEMSRAAYYKMSSSSLPEPTTSVTLQVDLKNNLKRPKPSAGDLFLDLCFIPVGPLLVRNFDCREGTYSPALLLLLSLKSDYLRKRLLFC